MQTMFDQICLEQQAETPYGKKLFKGTILWNIFFLKNGHIGCIDLWNDSGLQKLP